MTPRSQAGLRVAVLFLAMLAPATRAGAVDGLPADAEIPVRLVGPLTWAESQATPSVRATVERDVRSSGRVVVPLGSEMRGSLVPPPGGAATEHRLVFSEVVIDGKVHRLSARPIAVVVSVSRRAFYCGTPTLRGEPPFKLGEYVELSLPAGVRWTVRLSRPLIVG